MLWCSRNAEEDDEKQKIEGHQRVLSMKTEKLLTAMVWSSK